jgi:phosphoribosyl-dephospho-CoA transferase
MSSLTRNQLVWLHSLAWTQIEDRVWDAQAQDILAHWRGNSLPLVVCRQRVGTAPDQVCLGLPAPRQWSKRRLALAVSSKHITACRDFPSLLQVAQENQWGQAASDLSEALAADGVAVHVYGSHGWQLLTGLAYLHAESDIDLSLSVGSLEAASRAVQQLEAARLPGRVDGEIVFPAGQAVAWRELHQLLNGQTSQVLVKDRLGIRLASMTEVGELAQSGQFAERPTPLAWN